MPQCTVESYSGYKLHERPKRFTWDGQWLAVENILDRWYSQNYTCFLVATAEGGRFLLKYQERQDFWEVSRLARPPAPA
jgi:hypothetical protein